MVLSIGRARPRWLLAGERSDGAPIDRAAWIAERGAVRWALTADLLGAWPGFDRDGGRRGGAKARLTERYLLVDEERPHGFALPFAAIVDVGLVGREAAAGAALLVRYRDDAGVRSFIVEPRGARLFRLDQGLAGAAAALREAGLRVADLDLAPTLAYEWGRARAFADENVIWSGLATAPIDLWGELAPADVWLSTRSLLWSRAGAANLLRLPLEAIADATPFDSSARSVPGVALGAIDAEGGRADLLLWFDRHAMPDRNARERGAFLVGLRSRGVRVAALPSPLQPWLDGVWRRTQSFQIDGDAGLEREDAPLTPPMDAAIVSTPPLPATDAATSSSLSLTGRELAATDGDGTGERGLPRVTAFEAGALRVLAAIRGGDDAAGRLLIGTSLARALAELDDAAAVGALTPEQTERRRERLVALNEAAIRLRALAELRAGGYVGDGDFDRKRRTILEPLAERIFRSA
jgi:hypothetical protein